MPGAIGNNHKMKQDLSGQEASPKQEPLDRLKAIILDGVDDRMKLMEKRLDDQSTRAREVSKVLPEALKHFYSSPEELGEALQPTLAVSIKESVEENPEDFADAVFPIMGPAIRKYILDTIRSMLQTMNQLLDRSLSIQGIKWRLEALLSKRSFAEVVFLHSMKYRVEQVFLIHRESGLLLHHVARDKTAIEDIDNVSGMLTAIRDFIGDSFGSSENHFENQSMNVGELTISTKSGPKVILAAVIRGVVPSHMNLTLQKTLEDIHLAFQPQLADFNGEVEVFQSTERLLKNCLLEEEINQQKRRWPGILLLSCMTMLAALAIFWHVRHRNKVESYLNQLKNTPGIVINSWDYSYKKTVVHGLIDPFTHIEKPENGLSESDFEFKMEGYLSLQPKCVENRIRSHFSLPESVSISYEFPVLKLKGTVPSGTVDVLQQFVSQTSYIQKLDTTELVHIQTPSIEALEREIGLPASVQISQSADGIVFSGNAPEKWIHSMLDIHKREGYNWHTENLESTELINLKKEKRAIERLPIFFGFKETKLADPELEKIRILSQSILKILSYCETLSLPRSITIEGYADSRGSDSQNQAISKKRARHVKTLLIEKGIPAEFIHIRPIGHIKSIANQTEDKARKVLIKIDL
ncbi:MAG: hypothetical protein CR997_13130 [Acidobacteria bacterium]|nr:MAG: hypothetical protein CR997_13130 [Acidobacteriota bacterium]